MRDQVSKVCQTAYLEIRRIGSIRKYFTTEDTKTLISFLVMSRFDYCNSSIVGVPQKHLASSQTSRGHELCSWSCMQSIQVWTYQPSSSWFALAFCVSENQIQDCHCPYLAYLLQLYTPSRSLRSSADSSIFSIPIRCKKFQGRNASSNTGPVIWNSLPFSVRHA